MAVSGDESESTFDPEMLESRSKTQKTQTRA